MSNPRFFAARCLALGKRCTAALERKSGLCAAATRPWRQEFECFELACEWCALPGRATKSPCSVGRVPRICEYVQRRSEREKRRMAMESMEAEPSMAAEPSMGPGMGAEPSLDAMPGMMSGPSMDATPSMMAVASMDAMPSMTPEPSMDTMPSAMAEPSMGAAPGMMAEPSMSAAASMVGEPSMGPCAYRGVDRVTIGMGTLPPRDGWTPVSRGGMDGLVWEAGGGGGIVRGGSRGVYCFDIRLETAGDYYLTAVTAAEERTEHNDWWMNSDLGFRLLRGSETMTVAPGKWTKGYQNKGAFEIHNRISSVDGTPHSFLVPDVDGQVEVCVAARSTRFEAYKVVLAKCVGGCTPSDMAGKLGLRTLTMCT